MVKYVAICRQTKFRQKGVVTCVLVTRTGSTLFVTVLQHLQP